jgi:hypothetical protein
MISVKRIGNVRCGAAFVKEVERSEEVKKGRGEEVKRGRGEEVKR